MTVHGPDCRVSVLFVCMGNICRSPTAHGVFRKLVQQSGLAEQIAIDSAGTHAYHVGEAPDRRARATAERRGIDLSDLRARKTTPEDFLDFDYVLAMDAFSFASRQGTRGVGGDSTGTAGEIAARTVSSTSSLSSWRSGATMARA